MPFASHVFRHAPALRGRIKHPDASEMRISFARFAELDLQAEAEGWPAGWRMEHDLREANRREILDGRLGSDLWVFAYGSLIWDPAVAVDEYRYGSIEGWRRRFCMRLDGGRASLDRPGLMAALDDGGRCDGVAFRIEGGLVDRETDFMWRREMFAGAYRPIFVPVETPQGPVEALTFVMDQSNHRYTPDLPEEKAARMIALAEGRMGPNFDYLDLLVRHLDDLGIEDEDMRRLHAKAVSIRNGVSQDPVVAE